MVTKFSESGILGALILRGELIVKVGVRKPSIKKSISARTKGRVTRAVKKSVNPLYGKKGMGVINDPKKAVYNKIYNKTSIGVKDIYASSGKAPSYSSSSTRTGSAYSGSDAFFEGGEALPSSRHLNETPPEIQTNFEKAVQNKYSAAMYRLFGIVGLFFAIALPIFCFKLGVMELISLALAAIYLFVGKFYLKVAKAKAKEANKANLFRD